MELNERIQQRMRQFLVHSFLYYKLDESIIEDYEYDRISNEMTELLNVHAHVAKALPYYELCVGDGGAASGFHIKTYPPEIVTVALRMLWYYRKRQGQTEEDFGSFVLRNGFYIVRE